MIAGLESLKLDETLQAIFGHFITGNCLAIDNYLEVSAKLARKNEAGAESFICEIGE